MCGIFSVFNFDNENADFASFVRAINTVSHRGPDNCSNFYDDNCFLGHTRLSILDLDPHSNQPFFMII